MGSKKGRRIAKFAANPFYAAQESLINKADIGGKVDDITGVTAAKRAASIQEAALLKQQQQEKLNLAEAEDEIKRRRYLARAGGRRSLISRPTLSAASGKGTSDQLGD